MEQELSSLLPPPGSPPASRAARSGSARSLPTWSRGPCAVLRKNAVLSARNRRDAAREVLLPLVLLGVLIALGRAVPPRSYPAVVAPDSARVAPLAAAIAQAAAAAAAAAPAGPGACASSSVAAPAGLWLAPCAGADAPAVAAVAAALAVEAGPAANVTCFASESALLAAYVAPGGGACVFGAVVFDALAAPRVAYRLRLDAAQAAGSAPNVTAAVDASGAALPPSQAARAYARAVLPLQDAVDAAVAGVLGVQPALRVVLAYRAFPAPAFEVDTIGLVLAALVPTYLTFVFALQVRVLLTRLLEEKERKLRAAMRMMGLSDVVYLASWVVTATVKYGVLTLAVTAIVCGAGIFARSAPGVVIIFFSAFCLSCIAFCLAAAACFSSSRTGGAIGMAAYLLSSFPAYALTYSAVPVAGKLAFAALSPCAFSLGAAILQRAESANRTTDFSTWTDASDIGVSLAALTAALFVDSALYLLLAYYLDRVLRMDGIALHPLYFLGVSWPTEGAAGRAAVEAARALARGGRSDAEGDSRRGGGDGDDDDKVALLLAPSATLAAPARLPPASSAAAAATSLLSSAGACEPLHADVAALPGVVITDLCKVYTSSGRPRLALDGLSLTCHEGQVTGARQRRAAAPRALRSLLRPRALSPRRRLSPLCSLQFSWATMVPENRRSRASSQARCRRRVATRSSLARASCATSRACSATLAFARSTTSSLTS